MDETSPSRDETAKPYMIAEIPEDERPRERLERHGADTLSDAELVAILLRTGRAGRSVVDVARDTVAHFENDLRKISEASITEIQKIPGIGKAKAVEIKAAFTLARRLSDRDQKHIPRLESPEQVAGLMREKFRNKKQEEFHVLLLNTKHGLIRDEIVTMGLVDRSQVHAREVFRSAIKESCSRIIVTHNHPSGDPAPSDQDINCTKNLVAAGKIVGIEILDHVVIGAKTDSRQCDYVSLREAKYM